MDLLDPKIDVIWFKSLVFTLLFSTTSWIKVSFIFIFHLMAQLSSEIISRLAVNVNNHTDATTRAASYFTKIRERHQDDGGLAIVRIKPMGAGGGGVESSGNGLDDLQGALRFNHGIVEVTSQYTVKQFSYPKHIIPPDLDNEGVYNQFIPHRIDVFFEGINVNVMCYGQTGTGKTHTIFGSPGIMERAGRGDYGLSLTKNYGIFPRALLETYSRAKNLGFNTCVLTCSAIELSMLGNKCMFETDRKQFDESNAKIRWSPESYGVTIDRDTKPPKMYGMKEIILENDEDILRTFSAISTRNTAGTTLNDSSSRTHCFTTLKLYMKTGKNGDRVRITRFQFVDLAGSERLKDASGTTNPFLNAQAFNGMVTNFSLTMLSQAVRALVQQRARERKNKTKPKPFLSRAYPVDLVQLLSETMTGRALTAIIVCLSQAPANATQSSFALNFGSSFAKLRVKGSVVKPTPLTSLVSQAENTKKEAEKALESNISSKFVIIRRAQKIAAEQLLEVLKRLSDDKKEIESEIADMDPEQREQITQ